MRSQLAFRAFFILFLTVGFTPCGWAATVFSSMDTQAPYLMDVGAGLMVGDGDALPGADAQIVARLNTTSPLYVGGEFGVFMLTDRGRSAAVIPILGTIFTQFETSPRLHVRLGISLGPTLATGGGYSTARLALLLNPAMIFDLGGDVDLNAQARFGVVGSTFIILPQLGVTFAI